MDGTGDHYPKSAKNIVVATTFHQDGVKQTFKKPIAQLYYNQKHSNYFKYFK